MAGTLDLTQLSNPFAYKEDGEEALQLLEDHANGLYEFFGLADSEADFYTVWNMLAASPSKLIVICLSAGSCTRIARQTPSASSIVSLVAIAFLESAAGFQSADFDTWLKASGASRSGPLTVDQVCEQYKTWQSENGAIAQFRNMLVRHLNEDEKKELLMAYTFSRPHHIGVGYPAQRHVHCGGERIEGALQREFGECGVWCEPPAADEFDDYIGQLATRLYAMRSASVHRGVFALISSVRDTDTGTVPQTADVYPLRNDKWVSYTTRLSLDRVLEIFARISWRHFLSLES